MRIGIVAICLLLLSHQSAHAQGAPSEETANASPQELEHARAQFLAGNALLEKGDLDGAIVAFQESHAAAGRPSALFMLGVSYRRRFEASGEADDARKSLEYYRLFIAQAPSHGKVPEARDTEALLGSLVAGAEKRKAEGASAAAMMGSRAYRQAVGLVGEARFAEAIEAGMAARAQATTGPEEVSLIWAIVARAQALLGDTGSAVQSFQKALSLDPKLRVMSDVDAADTAALGKARTALRGKAPLAISARGQKVAMRGAPVKLVLHIDSDPMLLVDHLVLSYRWDGTDSFTVLPGEDGAAIEIPASTGEQERLFYFVTAVDSVGATIASSGTPGSPLFLEVVSEAVWKQQNTTTSPGNAGFRLGGIASVAVGTGVIILGALQGLDAKKESDRLHKEYPESAVGAGGWSTEAHDDLEDALRAERNMIVLMSAGAAAVIGGGILYYLGSGGEEQSQAADSGLSFGADVSSDGGFVALQGGF